MMPRPSLSSRWFSLDDLELIYRAPRPEAAPPNSRRCFPGALRSRHRPPAVFTGDLSTVAYYLIVGPIYLTLLLFFSAAITNLFVMLFVRSAKSGVETTFRIFCFASPPYTLTLMFDWLLPILILLVLLPYGLFLTFFGIREMHRTATVRAALASVISLGAFLGTFSLMSVFV